MTDIFHAHMNPQWTPPSHGTHPLVSSHPPSDCNASGALHACTDHINGSIIGGAAAGGIIGGATGAGALPGIAIGGVSGGVEHCVSNVVDYYGQCY